MADSILTGLIQQLGALAYEEYQVLSGVGNQLKSLEKEQRFLKLFLRNSEGKQEQHILVRALVEQIREVAFEAEDFVETTILNVERQRRRTLAGRFIHSTEHTMMRRRVAQKIASTKVRIGEIYANKERHQIDVKIGSGRISTHFDATIQRRRREVDEEMVGYKDVRGKLLKQLTKGSGAREIISIVGMGGLGKTTVANKLYNHVVTKAHFKYRAWVTVSEEYDTRQVILTIFNNIMPQASNLEHHDTEKIKEMLRMHLEKKYLMVLDDVWQSNMWDEVQACFPDTGNKSRILITTRIVPVARHASPRDPHFLRLLEPEESWELFKKKVFRGESCPFDLEQFGKEIVARCKGLPLSIVVIASMLASQEKSVRIWEKILTDVSVHLSKDETCLEILALSYHNLPEELKPCFLYFAAFPEDFEISAKRLFALWLAEGFIEPFGELTPEVVAGSYLGPR